MKKIGVTPTGSFIVELTANEFEALEQLRKPSATGLAPTAAQSVGMTIAERIKYAAPRIRKLHPGKAEGVARSIGAMFTLKGGVSDDDIRQTVAGLQKVGVLVVDAAGKVTYPKLPGAAGAA